MADNEKLTIRLHVSAEKYEGVSVEAFVAFEDMQAGSPTPNITGLRDFVAAFMVDEDNEPLPIDWARRVLGRLSVSELVYWSTELGKRVKDVAVPKESGTSSGLETAPAGAGPSQPPRNGAKRRGR